MSSKHGGSAFPVPQFSHGGNKATSHDTGMTLRDYFAAHMMAGDAANSADDASFNTDAAVDGLRKRARLYYRMADAMLAVRDE